MQRDLYAEVSARILAELERGAAPCLPEREHAPGRVGLVPERVVLSASALGWERGAAPSATGARSRDELNPFQNEAFSARVLLDASDSLRLPQREHVPGTS